MSRARVALVPSERGSDDGDAAAGEVDRDVRTGLGKPWRVIVRNDNHNTFRGVASALSSVIPAVGYDRGIQLANRIRLHHVPGCVTSTESVGGEPLALALFTLGAPPRLHLVELES